jgi:hypothetical protein
VLLKLLKKSVGNLPRKAADATAKNLGNLDYKCPSVEPATAQRFAEHQSYGFSGLGLCGRVGRVFETRHPMYLDRTPMARWPRHVWTSIFTYATVFVLFPLLCLLAYAWVRGWIF